ncbi:hypothetical protein [Streptomyces aidingensis]|uniref:Uncharacterized protein n=1 Tax=Streptomyces aidingensis TaxID=910347 RepID=A0A1I1FW83_9ACTN|nr:hypothetical protein [Streptomyces aidingensis]SFC01313.1 hypothetical protein SAMN05421773_101821 [Streptomyces aidingensis]
MLTTSTVRGIAASGAAHQVRIGRDYHYYGEARYLACDTCGDQRTVTEDGARAAAESHLVGDHGVCTACRTEFSSLPWLLGLLSLAAVLVAMIVAS